MCGKKVGAEKGEGRECVFEGTHKRRRDRKRRVRKKVREKIWNEGLIVRMRAEGIDEKDE